MSHRTPFAALASLAALAIFISPESSQGRCSSGNPGISSGFRGLRASGSGQGLTLAAQAIGLSNQRGIVFPPNILLQRQMQLASNYRLQSIRRSQDQQSLLVIRQARAAHTRQYRGDRIARARAQREARTLSSGRESDAMTLVSVRARLN